MKKIVEKFKRILKENRKILVSICMVLLIAIIGVVGLYLRFSNKANNVFLLDVRGKVLDFHSQTPLENITIRIGDKKVITDSSGFFEFDDVYSNSVLTLNGEDFYEDVKIDVNGRSEIIVLVDSKLYTFLRSIETFEKQRKYKFIYNLLSKKLRSKYGLNEYLDKKNVSRDSIVDTHQYKYFDLDISRDIEKLADDKVKIKMFYKWSSDGEIWDIYEKEVICIFEDNNWFIDDSLVYDFD